MTDTELYKLLYPSVVYFTLQTGYFTLRLICGTACGECLMSQVEASGARVRLPAPEGCENLALPQIRIHVLRTTSLRNFCSRITQISIKHSFSKLFPTQCKSKFHAHVGNSNLKFFQCSTPKFNPFPTLPCNLRH